MTTYQKIMTPIYTAAWIFLAWALYNDVFVWRATDSVNAKEKVARLAKAPR